MEATLELNCYDEKNDENSIKNILEKLMSTKNVVCTVHLNNINENLIKFINDNAEYLYTYQLVLDCPIHMCKGAYFEKHLDFIKPENPDYHFKYLQRVFYNYNFERIIYVALIRKYKNSKL